VLYVVDPESAAAAAAAGVGGTVELAVGGKSHPNNGPPVPMTVVVEAVTDGTFTYGVLCIQYA
jgi:microcystin degradation protein MlrC